MEDVLEVLWVFVPVIGAAIAHGPVMHWDLLPTLKRPIDGGRTFRGRRLFGDNKTLRGGLMMFIGVLLLTLALSRWSWFWERLPEEIKQAGPWLYGCLLGAGTVLAELPNSFIKRQIGVAPGTQRRSVLGIILSIYDQGDFVFGIWLALLPIWTMSLAQAIIALLFVSSVHVVVNVIGYAIGVRNSLL